MSNKRKLNKISTAINDNNQSESLNKFVHFYSTFSKKRSNIS